MSDVTAEEIEAERERADVEMDKMACACDCRDFTTWLATALAVRAREARREALMEAAGVCRLRGQFTMAAAIRALMGPET